MTAWTAASVMGFSRKEHWSGSHSLLQGIFLNQRLNLGFPHCRQILYQLSHQGSPWWECTRLIRPLDPKGAREGARLPWPASFSKNNSCSTFFFFDVQFSSVTQLCPTLRLHESQHARPPCPSPTPGVHPDSRPSSQ